MMPTAMTFGDKLYKFLSEHYFWVVITVCSMSAMVITHDAYLLWMGAEVGLNVFNIALQLACIHMNIKTYRSIKARREAAILAMAYLSATLFDYEWVKTNEDRVRELLPQTWTHMDNVMPSIVNGLKELGINWKDDAEAMQAVYVLELLGIMQREGPSIRRNPNTKYRVIRNEPAP